MKVTFLGSSDLGAIALRKLAESHHKVVLVVTIPDRPKGRGRKIEPEMVKMVAEEFGIPVIQPPSIKDPSAFQRILDAGADIIAVASYGEYIPSRIFEIPPFKSVNVHPSLLPRWRGASPVRYALLEGDPVTGVTIQYVDKKMDAGDILLQAETEIDPDENHGELSERLYKMGASLLIQALDALEKGEIVPIKQDESLVTMAPKIGKDDVWLDFSQPAFKVRNRIRAFSPSPGARALFRNLDFKILKASKEFRPFYEGSKPGEIVALVADGPVVACADASILLEKLQAAGKSVISGKDFLNGFRPNVGEVFEGKPLEE